MVQWKLLKLIFFFFSDLKFNLLRSLALVLDENNLFVREMMNKKLTFNLKQGNFCF